jgi:hypothetical protein
MKKLLIGVLIVSTAIGLAMLFIFGVGFIVGCINLLNWFEFPYATHAQNLFIRGGFVVLCVALIFFVLQFCYGVGETILKIRRK